MLWKLDGLSEYDIRLLLTRTGTSLLGLVKHVASTELGYLGEVFGRPFGERLPWEIDIAAFSAGELSTDAMMADMWATADESREQITGLYRRVWAHSDATIEALELDATGQVPWWPAGRDEVTLHRILVHVLAETNRHAGHADLVGELIDGAAGLQPDNGNLPTDDPAWWESHRDKIEQAARQAAKS